MSIPPKIIRLRVRKKLLGSRLLLNNITESMID